MSKQKCFIASIKFFLIIFLFFLQYDIISAFPTSPGSCNTGKAVSGSHATSSSGFIEEGGYEILINGAPLSDSDQLHLYPYMSHSWEIRTKGSGTNTEGPELGFLGLLFRLSNSNNVDISDIITLDEASQFEAKILDRSTFPLCPLGTVAVGHISRSEKEVISGTFFIEEEIDDLRLEVTLVAANGDAGNRWYYSEYGLTVLFPTLSPAPSTNTYPPSNSPTSQPSSGGPCFHEMQLHPKLVFKYRMDEDIDEKKFITGELVYTGQAWISIGITSEEDDFRMIGSQAIIGIPYSFDIEANPGMYSMTSIKVSGVNLLADEYQTLFNHSIRQGLTKTTLTFSKYLDEPGHNLIKSDEPMSFLYAVGNNNDFTTHRIRGNFMIDLSKDCDIIDDGPIAASGIIVNRNLWRIHGILAALAWAVATPLGILASMFRHMWMEKGTFLKVHMYLNLTSLVLTVISVIISVYVFVDMGRDHLTKPHHIIGIIVLILTCALVISGMLRPPAGKPASKTRVAWEYIHRTTGIVTFFLSIYQIFSGIKLNSELYMEWDGTLIYAAWLITLGIVIGSRRLTMKKKSIPDATEHTIRVE